MVLPFQEEVVNDKEYSKRNFLSPNFIGYLNTYGKVLDYDNPLGAGGHDCDMTTKFFERYFEMPMYDQYIQQFDGISVVNYESQRTIAKENFEFLKKIISDRKPYCFPSFADENAKIKLREDLYEFFYNCYHAETFMDGFGQNCMILNEVEFHEKCKKGNVIDSESDYYWYRKRVMLDWYKSVIVQYIHYHLIDRCEKGITTSNLRPYETFYNYLLNDFKIHQIPCMTFDPEKKKYVQYSQNEFLIPDSEIRLREEIKSIKRLVPLEERSRFYR